MATLTLSGGSDWLGGKVAFHFGTGGTFQRNTQQSAEALQALAEQRVGSGAGFVVILGKDIPRTYEKAPRNGSNSKGHGVLVAIRSASAAPTPYTLIDPPEL